MLLVGSLLSLVISIQYVWALKITFPSSPTAAQNNTFLWMREQVDPGTVWLRKQKLDADIGATPWSDDTLQLNLTKSTGSAQIHFNRAGLFYVGAFKTDINPRTVGDSIAPISMNQFTVSVNPTSAGAISGTSSTPPPVSSTSSVASPSTPTPLNDKNGAKRPHKVAVIVGLTVGFITLGIIGAIIFYLRYRRRRKADMTPPIVTPFSDTTVYSVSRTDIKERKRQLIGQRERLERQSRVDEQAPQTSPANNQTDNTGIDQLRDTMQNLRRQMDVVTQRMATLEAGTARPPDYSSGLE
ncbi:hypothetical protein E1B28_013094 [Marasmius oreades]|uniref:Mid2 domain-containing protein n=1 Tax=Marasmius oreades TaxID=181124 RepID=A0A9P7RPS5_9AGAR|nr:uncharacterized protein E1B28_013094 [Marasmius oreades]KAG7087113.1 hypothetical protein E1B28_013094 [Marasmius oreades]